MADAAEGGGPRVCASAAAAAGDAAAPAAARPVFGVRSVHKFSSKGKLMRDPRVLRVTDIGIEMYAGNGKFKRVLRYDHLTGINVTESGARAVFLGTPGTAACMDVSWSNAAEDNPPDAWQFLRLVADAVRSKTTREITIDRLPDASSTDKLRAVPDPPIEASTVVLAPNPESEAMVQNVWLQREDPAERMGIRMDQDLQVLGAEEGTPAARAGIEKLCGGRVVAIDGHPVSSLDDVRVRVPLTDLSARVSIAIRGATHDYFAKGERDPVLFPVDEAEEAEEDENAALCATAHSHLSQNTPSEAGRRNKDKNAPAAADVDAGSNKPMVDCARLSLNRLTLSGSMGLSVVSDKGEELLIVDVEDGSPAHRCGLGNYIGHRLLAVAPSMAAQENIGGTAGTVTMYYSTAVPVRTTEDLARQLIGRYAVELYISRHVVQRRSPSFNNLGKCIAAKKRTYSQDGALQDSRMVTKHDIVSPRGGGAPVPRRRQHNFEDDLLLELLEMQKARDEGSRGAVAGRPARGGVHPPTHTHGRGQSPHAQYTASPVSGASPSFAGYGGTPHYPEEPAAGVLAREYGGSGGGDMGGGGGGGRELARPLKGSQMIAAGLQRVENAESLLLRQNDLLSHLCHRVDRVERNTSRLLRAQGVTPGHPPAPQLQNASQRGLAAADPVEEWHRSLEMGRHAACGVQYRADEISEV